MNSFSLELQQYKYRLGGLGEVRRISPNGRGKLLGTPPLDSHLSAGASDQHLQSTPPGGKSAEAGTTIYAKYLYLVYRTIFISGGCFVIIYTLWCSFEYTDNTNMLSKFKFLGRTKS